MSLLDKASIVWPKGAPSKAGNLAAWNPQGQSLVEFDVVRATQKWRINEAGVWEALAANVIARDFTNGGCGDYLIEPARKNLFLNSTTGATQTITVVSGRNYAVSFSGTGSITFSGGATGTLNGTGATALDRVSEIKTTTSTSVTCTISGTVEYVNFEINTNDSSVAYATSWIETAGSIVTRNADVVSLSAASALLGDSAGGLFLEASFFQEGLIGVSDGTISNRYVIGRAGAGRFLVFQGGVSQSDINGGAVNLDGTFYKLAGRMSLNDVAFYFEGSVIGTDVSSNNFADGTITTVLLNGGGVNPFYGRIRQLVIFNQAPTDTQLELITTP